MEFKEMSRSFYVPMSWVPAASRTSEVWELWSLRAGKALYTED